MKWSGGKRRLRLLIISIGPFWRSGIGRAWRRRAQLSVVKNLQNVPEVEEVAEGQARKSA